MAGYLPGEGGRNVWTIDAGNAAWIAVIPAASSKLPSSTKLLLIIRHLLRPVECGPAGNNMGAIGRTW